MHFMVIFIKVNLDVLKLLKFVLVFCMTSLVTFFDSRMVTLNLSHTHTHPHTQIFISFLITIPYMLSDRFVWSDLAVLLVGRAVSLRRGRTG